MPKHDRRMPTDGELEILQVIWERGPSTVREVYRTISSVRDAGYTTILKLMQIMTDKGLLERNATIRPQVYRPVQTERQTQRQILRDLLDRAFSGSPGKLVLQALSTKKATPEERRMIRDLLDKLERDSR